MKTNKQKIEICDMIIYSLILILIWCLLYISYHLWYTKDNTLKPLFVVCQGTIQDGTTFDSAYILGNINYKISTSDDLEKLENILTRRIEEKIKEKVEKIIIINFFRME